MKAIQFENYGSPDVLQQVDVEKPIPTAKEVLIEVVAAAANPLDWRGIRADPFFVRFSDGLFKPKDGRVGADVAGVVAAVGADVARFQPGDAVFGETKGSFAEYACTHEKNLALKPTGVSFEAAAAVPVAGLTALQALRDYGQLKAGQQVLINGASGGIGTFAVQIAKTLGAEVTGVCSGRNAELVRSLGADQIIDYTCEDFRHSGKRYELVVDNVGNCSFADHKRLVKAGGIGLHVGFKTLGRLANVALLGMWETRFGQRKIGLMMAHAKADDLAYLGELLGSGRIQAVIDRCYPLAETAEALRYLETGRARGKVVISVRQAL